MKTFLQIVISFGLMLWLAVSSLDMAGRLFVKDVVELHGSQIVGSNISIARSSISLPDRTLLLSDLCFSDVENAPLFCAGLISVHFAPDFSPSFKEKGLLPDLWAIDSIEVKDVAVVYHIDSEGDNIQGFGLRLLRDSLNAKARDAGDALLLNIKELKISSIRVDARSKKTSDRSRSFSIGNIAFTDLGLEEGGVAPVEVINQMTRAIVDSVMVEADREGLIEKNRPPAEVGSSRRRAAAKDDGKDGEKGAGKDLRELGEGIKDTSKKLWKNTKDLFN